MTPRILVVGGGYVGLYAALRLQRTLRAGEATVTVVDPRRPTQNDRNRDVKRRRAHRRCDF